jgi:LacI family transcriptional regulator
MPSIKDVARLAGVAPITVSRVINDSGYVADKTRKKVEDAIEALGYVPNRVARSLRSKQTNTLALVLTDITNPFWTTIARGVEDVASQEGFSVVLCNTDENEAKEHNYVQVLLQKQVDGFLLVPANSTSRSIGLIQKQQVPLVVLDRTVPNEVDTVKSDSVDGAYRLTQHLLDQGHRYLAMLSGPREVSTAVDRVKGYKQALADFASTDGDGAVRTLHAPMVLYGEFTQRGGYAMMQRLLTLAPVPTAVFAANNFIAIGAFRALREAGLRVPADIALVAFDDLPLTFMLAPFLTVAAQSVYERGRRAAELLLRRLVEEDHGPPTEILMPVEIIIRQSSARRIGEPEAKTVRQRVKEETTNERSYEDDLS